MNGKGNMIKSRSLIFCQIFIDKLFTLTSTIYIFDLILFFLIFV
jgi:hypothetical protein